MTNINKKYDTASIKDLGKSKIEITGSIPSSEWEKYRKEALSYYNQNVQIDGFRKGNIPENILINKIGEAAILEEMAEISLSKVYIDIIIDNKIDAIGKPEIQVTKLAKGNPLEFKAVTSVIPKVNLPEWKKITKDIVSNKPEVEDITEKDIEEAVLKVRKQRVDHSGHDHEKMSPEEHEKQINDSLPELNDEFVKSLGDFKDVTDFKEKIKLMLKEKKADEAREKLRIKIADAIGDKTTIDMPDLLIESELDRTEGQFKTDIERMGVKMEDYLKHAKKNIEEIRKEWRPHAEKKAKLQLILNAISQEEKLMPSKEEIESEVNHIVAHYKDADREKATVYAETVLTNEKVFQFLENVK